MRFPRQSPAKGELVFKTHRLLYHPTLGLKVIKKKKKQTESSCAEYRSYSKVRPRNARRKVLADLP